MPKFDHPERVARARATKAEFATLTATDAGRGCWFPEKENVDGFKRLKFTGFATGKGICIGIMDSGMDPYHPSLFHISKDTSGNLVFTSRIRAIWDQFQNPKKSQTTLRADAQKIFKQLKITTPYGTILMHKEINQMLKDRYDPPNKKHKNVNEALFKYDLAHGTTCALLAAGHGSGLAEKSPIGVAPEADLIFVRHVPDCYIDEKTIWDKPTDYPASPEVDAMAFCALIAKSYASKSNSPLVINKSFGSPSATPYRQNEYTAIHETFLKGSKNLAVVTSTGNQGYKSTYLTFKSRPRSAASLNNSQKFEMQSVPLKLIDDVCKTAMKACDGKYVPVSGTLYFHALKKKSVALGEFGFGVFASAEPPNADTPKERTLEFREIKANGTLSNTSRPKPDFIQIDGAYRSLQRLLIPGYKKVPLYLFANMQTFELFPGSNDEMISFSLSVKPASGEAFKTLLKPFKTPYTFELIFRAPADEHITCAATGRYRWKAKHTSRLFITGDPKYVHWDGSKDNVPVFSKWGGPALPTKGRHQLAGRATINEIISVGAHDQGDPDTVSWYSQKGPVFEYATATGTEPLKPDVTAQGDMDTFVQPKSYAWNTAKTGIELPKTAGGWGTSYAGPITAGTVALMMDALAKEGKPITHAHIRSALIAGAVTGGSKHPADMTDEEQEIFFAESGAGATRAFEGVKAALA